MDLKLNRRVLIVEDEFVEANDIRLMLRRAGYEVCGIARSVDEARKMIKMERPGLVLVDIFLKGKLTGIDLAWELKKDNIAFIYLSANSNEEILATAKVTEPYGFIVKPFREKDLLITLEIAHYRHQNGPGSQISRNESLVGKIERIEADQNGLISRFLQIGRIIQQEMPFDYPRESLVDPERRI